VQTLGDEESVQIADGGVRAAFFLAIYETDFNEL
jgi:hypothetical protein